MDAVDPVKPMQIIVNLGAYQLKIYSIANKEGHILKVTMKYLENKKIIVGEEEIVVSRAVPQRSVLDPILWTIIHDGILRAQLKQT